MPAYNFQKQFAPKILDLSKPHTIRPERKYPTKVGDVLSLYTGQRTKACELIACAPCTHVEVIKIYPQNHAVVIDGDPLMFTAIDRLAERDGFKSRDAFFEFFMRYPREIREGKLRLIWWSTKGLIRAAEFVTHRCKCAVVEVRHG